MSESIPREPSSLKRRLGSSPHDCFVVRDHGGPLADPYDVADGSLAENAPRKGARSAQHRQLLGVGS